MRNIKSKYEHKDDNERLITLENIDEEKGTRLSTNTIAVLLFIGYLILGLLFYCYGPRHLSALDAVYLTVITFTTVGYGTDTIYAIYTLYYTRPLLLDFFLPNV